MKALSASARLISCRSAASIRLAAPSPSKSLMSFVDSVMKPRTSLKSVAGVEVEHEESQQRTQVLVGDRLVVFDVAERESHHGLGLEAG